MGLHNLESESVLDIIQAFEGDTELSGTISTIHQIFETYGSVPNAPLSTQAELVDLSNFQETMARYTVWKGVLFDLQLDKPAVCWHPKAHSLERLAMLPNPGLGGFLAVAPWAP